MRFNRKKFLSSVRPMSRGGKLTQEQVDGFEAILAAWEEQAYGADVRFIAYSLATAWHETAFTMQPIAEFGKGKGYKYGEPAGKYKQIYYGRGYVQLTWLVNYEKAGAILGVDLVERPDLAMEHATAAKIMIQGMVHGWFTGRKLSHYFTESKTDYVGARRIINGMDRNDEIARYAEKFEKALRASETTEKPPVETKRKSLAETRTAKTAAAGIGLSTLTVAGDSVQSVRGAFDKVTAATGLSIPSVLAVSVVVLLVYVIYLKWEDHGRPSLGGWFK